MKILKPRLFKALVYYQMMSLLMKAWKSIWVKFGPLVRNYHAQGGPIGKSREVIENAEHLLSQFHSWRRIMDMNKWKNIENELVIKKVCTSTNEFYQGSTCVESFKYFTKKIGNPLYPYVYVDAESQYIERSENKLARAFKARENQSYSKKVSSLANHTSDEKKIASTLTKARPQQYQEMLNNFRRKFIQGMITQGIYKNEQMNILLEDLVLVQGKYFSKEEDLVVEDKFPIQYIRRKIQQEFKFGVYED